MKASPALIAPILAGAARVALGALWINEGLLKYRAGFGSADILLVVESAKTNSRVPDFFKGFADTFLANWPHVFGFVVPLVETLLGIVLILGFFTLPLALVSVLELMSYWLADQLITQYPIMVVLSVIVIAFSVPASQFSLKTLAARILSRKRPDILVFEGAARRWL